MAKEGNTSALELFLVLVPELSHTSLRPEPVLRLKSVEILELALVLLRLLLTLLALISISDQIYLSKAGMEENKKANAKRKQRRVISHI